MAKKLKIFGWILSILVLLALVSVGTTAWLDFNIIEWLSFGMVWLYKTLATIVAVFGIIGLFSLIIGTFK